MKNTSIAYISIIVIIIIFSISLRGRWLSYPWMDALIINKYNPATSEKLIIIQTKVFFVLKGIQYRQNKYIVIHTLCRLCCTSDNILSTLWPRALAWVSRSLSILCSMGDWSLLEQASEVQLDLRLLLLAPVQYF